MITAIIPFLMVLIGFLIYTFNGGRDPIKELGRLMMQAGLFAIGFAYATVRFSV